MKKVFLGGTVNKSKWRDYVMPRLKINYFNPVVDDWDEEAYQRELYEREHSEFCLYVITPKMTGVYSIAEVVDDSHRRPWGTLFCMVPEDEEDRFTKAQVKSLEATGRLVERNGGKWLKDLDEVIDYLNSFEHDDSPLAPVRKNGVPFFEKLTKFFKA